MTPARAHRAAAVAAATLAGCVAAGVLLTGCGSPTPGRPSRSVTQAATVAPGSGPAASPPSVTRPAGPASIPAGRPGHPRGLHLGKVNQRDPGQVARAYLMTAFTSDTRIDRSGNDAARRARRWMTPQLAAAFTTALPGDGGASWATLTRARGYTTVTVDPFGDGINVIRPGLRVQVGDAVTVTDRTGKGSTFGDPLRLSMVLTLARDVRTAPWRVASVADGT